MERDSIGKSVTLAGLHFLQAQLGGKTHLLLESIL